MLLLLIIASSWLLAGIQSNIQIVILDSIYNAYVLLRVMRIRGY